ncbi:ATP-binding protein, partial [Sphingorhabdus sp.]|uniref:hybrid sensor histidine kinase/response regulator n=1 Tax=Sphingorhabdus sp. TaxID=1902408 RepID=UPI00391B8DC3
MREYPKQFTQLLDRRLKFAVGAGLLIPLLIYALIAITLAYRDDEFAAEAATLSRAQQISEAIDARLHSIEAVMLAVSVLPTVQEEKWAEAKTAISAVTNQNPDWENVIIRQLANDQQILEILPKGPAQLDEDTLKLAAKEPLNKIRLSNMIFSADGKPYIHAIMKFRTVSRNEYVLEVVLSPLMIQQVLMSKAPREGVSAVVDRRGMFVARTLDWEKRIGKPSTTFVRDAISKGNEGVYRGVTWEGMENYTAFFTSPQSNLSTHLAVTAALIDNRKLGGRLAAGLIALLTVALAAAVMVLTLRFASARRAAAARIEHAQRLEAVGQLTGGIAHDFNNMLAIVISSLDLAKRRLARGDSDVERFIDSAIDGAGRAADLTRRLLAFSRKQPLSPTTVDVNAVIKDSVEILHRTLPANISVSVSLAEDIGPVFVDRNQLENVLINLVVNARDAILDSGVIKISSEMRWRDDGSAWVALIVTDTGRGMSPDVAARAFEPFFTTKPIGKGTGLGLSQINGFVIQSGGEISIDSSVGEGTTVTVLLPQYEGQTSTPDSQSGAKSDLSLPAGQPDEWILLVEDEDQLRANIADFLQTAGYTVLQATSADDALSILEANRGICILVTDVILPTMDGRKLAEFAIEIIPNIKV